MNIFIYFNEGSTLDGRFINAKDRAIYYPISTLSIRFLRHKIFVPQTNFILKSNGSLLNFARRETLWNIGEYPL